MISKRHALRCGSHVPVKYRSMTGLADADGFENLRPAVALHRAEMPILLATLMMLLLAALM